VWEPETLPEGEVWDADGEVWPPVSEDEGELVAVTRVDGRLVVVVVHEVTSDVVDGAGMGFIGVSEREIVEAVAPVSVAVVEIVAVSSQPGEVGADSVDVTDVVLREAVI
jgi:hypothetical protein